MRIMGLAYERLRIFGRDVLNAKAGAVSLIGQYAAAFLYNLATLRLARTVRTQSGAHRR